MNPTFSGIMTGVLIVLFLGIWAWAWNSKNKAGFEAMAKLPLEENEQTHVKEEA